MTDAEKRPEQRPQVSKPRTEDGIELSDDDLDAVVGGLSPEASIAYAQYLQKLIGREPT